MVKHVLKDYYELAHVWAADRSKSLGYDDYGRCGNVDYTKDTINSYRWYPIGHYVRNAAGVRVLCILEGDNYSPSTTKHCSAVFNAVHNGGVPVVEVKTRGHITDYPAVIKAMIAAWHQRTDDESRRRNVNTMAYWQNEFDRHVRETKLVAKVTKTKLPKDWLRQGRKDLEVALSAVRKADERAAIRAAWTPEQQAKHEAQLERARERREVKKQVDAAASVIHYWEKLARREGNWGKTEIPVEELIESFAKGWGTTRPEILLPATLELISPEMYARYTAAHAIVNPWLEAADELRAKRAAEKAERDARIVKLVPEAEQMWRAGCDFRHSYSNGPGYDHLDDVTWEEFRDAFNMREQRTTLLRLKDGRVETSRHAQVTEREGKRLFQLYYCVMAGMAEFEHGRIYLKGQYIDNERIRSGNSLVFDSRPRRWEADQGAYKVDFYEVRWFTAEGDAQIGCHTLTKAEIDRFVTAQGWNLEPINCQAMEAV